MKVNHSLSQQHCAKFNLKSLGSELKSITKKPFDCLSNSSSISNPLNIGFIADQDQLSFTKSFHLSQVFSNQDQEIKQNDFDQQDDLQSISNISNTTQRKFSRLQDASDIEQMLSIMKRKPHNNTNQRNQIYSQQFKKKRVLDSKEIHETITNQNIFHLGFCRKQNKNNSGEKTNKNKSKLIKSNS